MKIEVLKVTPTIATQLLQRNVRNRNLSDRLVTKFEQDMRDGKWTTTHQGIAFYEDGTLADGQHRLTAIVRAGVPIKMMVVSGLKKSQSLDIDAGRSRSVIDRIKTGQSNSWITAKHISAINLLAVPKRLSVTEILAVAEQLEHHLVTATDCFASNRRGLNPAVILAALTMASVYKESFANLRRFSEVLISGISEGPDEKVIILAREALIRNQNNGESDKLEKLLKVEKAIHAYCNKEKVTRLLLPKEPVYPHEGLFNV